MELSEREYQAVDSDYLLVGYIHCWFGPTHGIGRQEVEKKSISQELSLLLWHYNQFYSIKTFSALLLMRN